MRAGSGILAAIAFGCWASFPILAVEAAHQSTPLFLGRFKDWAIWEVGGNDRRICYAVTESRPSGTGRPAVLVTLRPGQEAVDEVSLRSENIAEHGGVIQVEIDGDKFPFFKKNERAWLRGEADLEQDLLTAMRKGTEMTAKGLSGKEVAFVERFSLLGFTRAHEIMSEICRDSVGAA